MKQRRKRKAGRVLQVLQMPSKFLLSPSEVKLAGLLEDDAITSPLPEEKGADVLLYTDSGLLGWQRKEIPHDFIVSVTDGRFARALPLLTKSCTFHRLINEGRFKYWPDQTVHLGTLRNGKRIPSRFTKRQIHGILNDLEFVWGVQIHWTDDIDDTVLYLKSVRDFMAAKKHVGLYTRPKVQGTWFVPTAKEIELWILQSFPGIGPSSADAIIQHFGGKIPLSWNCTFDELAQVPKVGRKKALELWKALPSSPSLPATSVSSQMDFDFLRKRLGRC